MPALCSPFSGPPPLSLVVDEVAISMWAVWSRPWLVSSPFTTWLVTWDTIHGMLSVLLSGDVPSTLLHQAFTRGYHIQFPAKEFDWESEWRRRSGFPLGQMRRAVGAISLNSHCMDSSFWCSESHKSDTLSINLSCSRSLLPADATSAISRLLCSAIAHAL